MVEMLNWKLKNHPLQQKLEQLGHQRVVIEIPHENVGSTSADDPPGRGRVFTVKVVCLCGLLEILV